MSKRKTSPPRGEPPCRHRPLYEKVLDIHRRLLTDDHPAAAPSCNDLAICLEEQGKYARKPDRSAARRCAGSPAPESPTPRRPPPPPPRATTGLASNLHTEEARCGYSRSYEKRRWIPGAVSSAEEAPSKRPSAYTATWGPTSTRKEVRPGPAALQGRPWRLSGGCSATTTTKQRSATAPWRSASTRGKYAGQPLYEEALEIPRQRRLTENHPHRQRPATVWRCAADRRGSAVGRSGKAWRFADIATTTTPCLRTAAWHPTSPPRAGTPWPSRSTRRRWRSSMPARHDHPRRQRPRQPGVQH